MGPHHLEVEVLIGLGYENGIDGRLGSAYMIAEWDYPNIGLVIFDTPSGGHDTVMLDYSVCGPQGEPRVVYVGEDREPVVVADSFAEFIARLEDCGAFAPT